MKAVKLSITSLQSTNGKDNGSSRHSLGTKSTPQPSVEKKLKNVIEMRSKGVWAVWRYPPTLLLLENIEQLPSNRNLHGNINQ